MRAPVTGGVGYGSYTYVDLVAKGHEVYVIDTTAVGAPKLMGKKILRDLAAADTVRPTLSEFLSLLDVRDEALPNIKN